MQRTLKRELKELEVVEREAVALGTERQPLIITFNLVSAGAYISWRAGPLKKDS